MEISLSGRAAIVTGGSKGIGLAVATRFAASGADVAIFARGKETLDDAVAVLLPAKAFSRHRRAAADVAADIQRAYDEVMKALGKVDIIVNNAGTSRAMPFEKVTDEILMGDIEQKLFAAVRLIRLVSPQMKERRWGRIINVLNIGAKAPRPNSMPTSVSRAAGMAMTKALSAEFAPHNVAVERGRWLAWTRPTSTSRRPRRPTSRSPIITRRARRKSRSAAPARRRSSPIWRASSSLRPRAATSPAPRPTSPAAAHRWCDRAPTGDRSKRRAIPRGYVAIPQNKLRLAQIISLANLSPHPSGGLIMRAGRSIRGRF